MRLRRLVLGGMLPLALLGLLEDAHEDSMAAMSKEPMDNMADAANLIQVKAGGQPKSITWTFPDSPTTVIFGSHQPGDYAKGLKGSITVK